MHGHERKAEAPHPKSHGRLHCQSHKNVFQIASSIWIMMHHRLVTIPFFDFWILAVRSWTASGRRSRRRRCLACGSHQLIYSQMLSWICSAKLYSVWMCTGYRTTAITVLPVWVWELLLIPKVSHAHNRCYYLPRVYEHRRFVSRQFAFWEYYCEFGMKYVLGQLLHGNGI